MEKWFKKNQKVLLYLSNSFLGELLFNFKKLGLNISHIDRITPNSVAGIIGKEGNRLIIKEYFLGRNEFAIKLNFLLSFTPLEFDSKWMFIPRLLIGLTTTTFNSGNPSPVDGNVRSFSSADYNTAHTGTGSLTANPHVTNEYFCQNGLFTITYSINRSFLSFDTSSITSASTISSATLQVYGTGVNNDDGNDSAQVYSTSPASNSTLATSDFTNVGSTAFSTAIPFGSWNTAGYNNFALNASGISNINKTGISYFGGRTIKDVANSAPTGLNRANINFVANGSNVPNLNVTYSIPTSNSFFLMF